MGISLLELVMGDKPHAKTFVKFLSEVRDNRVVREVAYAGLPANLIQGA